LFIARARRSLYPSEVAEALAECLVQAEIKHKSKKSNAANVENTQFS